MLQSKKLAHGDNEKKPGIVRRLAFSQAVKDKTPRDASEARSV